MTAPSPRVLADRLEVVVKTLRAHGNRAVQVAPIYATEGVPAARYDRGPRSSDVATPTERAALNPHPNPYEGIDVRLEGCISTLWTVAGITEATIQALVAHAGDDDQLPAGSGTCECCGRVVRSDLKEGDRLKAGYCEACYRAWDRAGRPDRFEWVRVRRLSLGVAS